MKVVAYGIQACEREYLATANQKKHDITLISNPLTEETLAYAAGKHVVIIPENWTISLEINSQLTLLGVIYIIERKICNDKTESSVLQDMANEVIRKLDHIETSLT
jgi:D-lactate dehydrogenase